MQVANSQGFLFSYKLTLGFTRSINMGPDLTRADERLYIED